MDVDLLPERFNADVEQDSLVCIDMDALQFCLCASAL